MKRHASQAVAWIALGWIAVLWIGTTVVALPAAFGQSADSLVKCQKTVVKEGGKYVRAVADTVGKCLHKVSLAVIVDGGTPGDAAGDCVKSLLKIESSATPAKTLAGKFDAKVGKACDPAINPGLLHMESDIYTIGPTALSAANLGAYCQRFAGDGTIDEFDDWLDCVRTAADCLARQAIATQWPRALEYTAGLLTAPEIAEDADALAALTVIDAAIEGATEDNLPEIVCGELNGVCGDDMINVAGEQCDGTALGGTSCASLGFSGGTLVCSGCTFDTSGCAPASGDAAVGDVLAGKTFSNASELGLAGTMADNGAVTLTPGTANQAIAAGYHNGSGYCSGDADLAAGNIKAGTNLFGVAGTVIQASGGAAVENVLAGQTFSNAGAAGLTGTMPNNGAVTLTPGTANQTIAAGYHNGSGYCSGDSDLTEGNIGNLVSIFGVDGLVQAGPLKTGINWWHGPGSDGDLQRGAGFHFTNNFDDGTVTDHTTGLMWEKKSNDGSVHDKDNVYTWSGGGFREMNGTVTTVFLAELNSGSGFAGYTDWRLPNVNELLTLARYTLGDTGNKIASIFNDSCPVGCTVQQCSCTKLGTGTWYMSSTSNQAFDGFVYGVDFNRPAMDWNLSGTPYVRAVRGGYRGCTLCANEPATCSFDGTRLVRYGANGKYLYANPTGSIGCNNASFGGDPAPGVPKKCFVCDEQCGTEVCSPTPPSAGCCQTGGSCSDSVNVDSPAECQWFFGPSATFMPGLTCGVGGACE